MYYLLIVLLILSLACSTVEFILCGCDKFFAKHGRRRIPEKHFFWLAAAGGAPGLWLGMITFRHKTRHWYFWLIAVVFGLIYAMLIIALLLKIYEVI